MQINKVTITGADNKTNPFDLMPLTREFPYVEWGILVARGWGGKKRFPDKEWIDDLVAAQKANFARKLPPINLSMHVCDDWMEEILIGDDTFFLEMEDFLPSFQRIQINTHAATLNKKVDACLDVLQNISKHTQFIFQMDDVNGMDLLSPAMARNMNCVPLFDLSHGAGKSPDSWPRRVLRMKPNLTPVYCGYAGGLGPENITEELKRIEQVVDLDGGNVPIWIDMETNVRTDGKLDLNKVRACLVEAKPYVVGKETVNP